MFHVPFYSLSILSKYALHKSRDLGLSTWSGCFINTYYEILTTLQGHFYKPYFTKDRTEVQKASVT